MFGSSSLSSPYMSLISFVISFMVMVPSLFTSNIRKIDLRTSSGVPSDMMRKMSINSVKSIFIVVGVVDPEYVLLHFPRIFCRQSFLHHLTKILGPHLAVRMLCHEGIE